MLTLPFIQFFPSLYCNLKCPYCSQVDVRKDRIPSSSLYTNRDFLGLVERLPQTHFYISGGEPLIQPGLQDFLAVAAANGHRVSFDTNGVVGLSSLEKILDRFSPGLWGFFNISHHLLAGVPLATIQSRVALLRRAGIPHFVKYIGTPGEIDAIAQDMDILRDEGTGVMVTILETYSPPWQGRNFPRDYTDDELLKLLNLVTLNTHALQFFGGIRTKGRPCMAGSSYITYNMKNRLETTTCCHSSKEIHWEQTVFQGCDVQARPCSAPYCIGDLMFILGIQNLFDEKERFTRVCNGEAPSIGLNAALKFVEEIGNRTELVLAGRFQGLLQKISVSA